MAVYKNKFVLEAERMVKVGKYIAKACTLKKLKEGDPAARVLSDKESFQDLEKFKNIEANYKEINIAVLEELEKNKFQKQPKIKLPPHKEKKELLLETEGIVSRAINDASTKDLFDGRKNYKELVNDLNYPRGGAGQTKIKRKELGKEKWAWALDASGVFPFDVVKSAGLYGGSVAALKKKYEKPGWKLVQYGKHYHTVEKGKPYFVTISKDNKPVPKPWSEKPFDTYYVIYLKKVDAPGIFDNQLDIWYEMPYYGKANHLGQLHILEGGPLHCPVKLGEAAMAANAARLKAEDVTKASKPIIDKGKEDDATQTEKEDSMLASRRAEEANLEAKAAIKEAESGKIYAPHFVALAFRRFQERYNERARSKAGRLSPKSRFLKIIEPKKGYQNKMRAYEDFLAGIKEDFFADVLEGLEDSKKIKNIDDFSDLLMAHLKEIDEPITMVGYFEKYLNLYMTGLAVDIHDGDPSSDEEKIQFLEDPNYPVYAYFAKEEGFKIDPNVPWRLIADVRMADMQKDINSALFQAAVAADGWKAAAKSYASVNDTIGVFKYYNSVVNDNANKITFSYNPGEWPLNAQSYVLEPTAKWYNEFVSANPHYIVVESTLGGTKVVKKKRNVSIMSNITTLIFYARVRNYECRNALSTFKFKILEKTLKQIQGAAPWLGQANATDRVLDMIETMLGTYAARNLPLEQKALTKIEKSWTMVSSFTKYL